MLGVTLLVGCSSHSIDNYPKYTDQIVKSMSTNQSAEGGSFQNEIPDLSAIPNYVGPGFLYQISHPSDSRLSGNYRSDFNGILKLPYDVEINTSNKTFAEVKDSVFRSYNKFFQKGADGLSFGIAKKEFWVEVRGLVKKPGRYLIKSSDSLDLVVDAAGGVQGDISVEYFNANIKQQNYEYKVLLNKYFESSNSTDKLRWLGGDSVFISKVDALSDRSQEIPFVTVIGGVNKPGKILYQKDASLFYFIEKSGGTVQGLGYEESYIFRNTAEGVKKIHFTFNEPETIPAIMPNDTIFMNTQIRTTADRVLERISHITSIISTIALLMIAL
jgi:hypothetical protein